MAVLDIITMASERKGDRPSILSTPAEPVTNFGSDDLLQLVLDMIETLEADPICVGLAAPQVGVNVQLAVTCPSGDPEDLRVIINPTDVEETGQKDVKRESCMSLPDRAGNVERRKKLRVVCFDQDGTAQELEFEGFDARIAAHEVDHLYGKMYCDQVEGSMVDLDFDEVRKRIELSRQADVEEQA